MAASRLINESYKNSRHDRSADVFCQWVGLFGTCFRFVGYDTRRKQWEWRNIPPHQVNVEQAKGHAKDLQHFDCKVSIKMLRRQFEDMGTEQGEHTYQVWHGWYFWEETADGREIEGSRRLNPYFERAEWPVDDAGYPLGTEPTDGPFVHPFPASLGEDDDAVIWGYPVKPILYQQDFESDDIFVVTSDALVLQNQRIDRALTGVAFTLEKQGFAQLAMFGVTPEDMKGASLSPGGSMSFLDSDADAKYLHPVPQAGEVMSVIVRIMRTFARSHGLSPEAVDPDSKVVSGTARAQLRVELEELREKQFPRWVDTERETYWIASIVHNAHNAADRQMPLIGRCPDPFAPAAVDLTVEFGSLEPVVDPLAEALTIEHLLRMAVITEVDVIAARRRVSRERAQVIFDKNKEHRAANAPVAEGPTGGRVGQPGNPPENLDLPPSRVGSGTTSNRGNDNFDEA